MEVFIEGPAWVGHTGPVLEHLKGETVECVDGLGKRRNAALSPLPVGTSQELTHVLEVLATSICRDRQSQKDAVGMMLHCSKSGMTCLSLKTNTGSSKSQSERESDPLPPSVFEDATATPVKLCLNIFGFPAEPVTLLCTVFPFSLF